MVSQEIAKGTISCWRKMMIASKAESSPLQTLSCYPAARALILESGAVKLSAWYEFEYFEYFQTNRK
jgi:hypothetical protein